MNRAVIAIGSNINPQENVTDALNYITKSFSLVKKSRFIYTEPLGFKNQPNFLNGAVLIETASGETDIITKLKEIEQNLGRERKGRKDGPRRIDLDLVVYNGRIIDNDVFERDFLRQSIRQVLPDFTFHRENG
ncbi:2-amino-4-hydroxy-6-hydroxymethyldihydropteridine diphosphokinase [Rhodohalobacter sp. 8-1]|uniref:2-amino-4-hydroxy-6- hydroxymethyldihydropteridine diphosphokinase n=1 Tax=Rhodohalobacter sp. 8-1 TaxID=3131972 RepID=UPI0030EE0B0C